MAAVVSVLNTYGKTDMTRLAVNEHTGGMLVKFVLVFESMLGREHCLLGRRNCVDRSWYVAASSRSGPNVHTLRRTKHQQGA